MNVLEKQLSQLSFQGAGTTGWLNFSHSAAAIQTSVESLQIQNGQPVPKIISIPTFVLETLYIQRNAQSDSFLLYTII